MMFLKKISLFIAFFLGTFAIYPQITDPLIKDAKVNFEFTSKKVKGTISDVRGIVYIDKKNISNSKISGSAAVNTLKTGNFIRNSHLMSKKYFYNKMYPRISFESDEVIKTDLTYRVKGKLTLKGKTKEVFIEFRENNNMLKGELNLNTKDFDISVYKERKRNEVVVSFEFPLNAS